MPIRALAVSLVVCTSAFAAAPLNRTPAPGDYNKPNQTAAAMKLPDGFKVKVFAGEPDLVQPIAMCFDERGRIWAIENFSYPNWKATGRDRVVILEDTDGDGDMDTKKVFWDKGNFASGIQVGFGGVYVGSPPNLYFIPDKNRDDQPDGPAQVLLDGWGHHDTHETLNSFIWGPDGWLYGCQGVFTHSKVGKPGTPNDKRIPINAGVWRYHPTKHIFEVFAEGGSNQWGIDYNDHGQMFMTACVIPHLYHVIQGGYYKRQAGRHFNPHVYSDIQTIRTHQHYAAAFAGAMCYLGDQFPAKYRNQLFFHNIHASKVHMDVLERKGSGYVGKLGPHDIKVNIGRQIAEHNKRGTGFLNNGDKWVRGLALRTGPDGSVFINDWYDKRPCHQLRPHDQDLEFKTGRIYKVSYGDPKPLNAFDLLGESSADLAAHLVSKNDWWVRTARRVLQERAAGITVRPNEDKSKMGLAAVFARLTLDDQKKPTRVRLRALWMLHVVGDINDNLTLKLLKDKEEYIRAWAIQCEMEDRDLSDKVYTRLLQLAKEDDSQAVRLYLASACQRMKPAQTWPIVEALAEHEADKDDHNLPLMVWYAIEPLVAQDKVRALKLATTTKIPLLRQYIARRAASVK